MSDGPALTPDAARAIAALGGGGVDEAGANRIAVSVSGVTQAAANFRDEMEFDDSFLDFRLTHRPAE